MPPLVLTMAGASLSFERWRARSGRREDFTIYVGDGASDIGAFNLMHDNGGISIAVNQAEDASEWRAARHMYDGARVDNLAPADFSANGEPRRSLMLAVECVSKRVALRRLARND